MKLRGVLMVLVSLVLAGIAAVSANRWMTNRLAVATATNELSGVVAASKEIPFGTQLDTTMIKMVKLPPESVPKGAFEDPEAVVGRVAAFTLFSGEVLLDGRVLKHLDGSVLAAVVQEGKRAITVRVDDVVGVAGFLLPGNRVDVIATRRKAGAGGGTESRTLLENLKVLAVDQTTSPDKSGPVIVRAVTLEVDPAQAEEIVRAQQEGKVQLTLRNPLDGTQRELPEEPQPDQPTVVAKPAPPVINRTIVVEVLRGTSASSTTFGGEGPAPVDFAR